MVMVHGWIFWISFLMIIGIRYQERLEALCTECVRSLQLSLNAYKGFPRRIDKAIIINQSPTHLGTFCDTPNPNVGVVQMTTIQSDTNPMSEGTQTRIYGVALLYQQACRHGHDPAAIDCFLHSLRVQILHTCRPRGKHHGEGVREKTTEKSWSEDFGSNWSDLLMTQWTKKFVIV